MIDIGSYFHQVFQNQIHITKYRVEHVKNRNMSNQPKQYAFATTV